MADKENRTEMVFILDKSGSMSPLADDTIGGFNSMIEKQKKIGGDAAVTTVLFDTEIKRLHNSVDIKSIGRMTREDYTAGGCTALLDAIGTTLTEVQARQTGAKHTIAVIITDGMENASREYNYSMVHDLIVKRKEEGWEFIFLGANIDAERVGESIGVGKAMSVNYHADSIGTRLNFEAIGDAIGSLRENGAVADGWRNKIDEDFSSR